MIYIYIYIYIYTSVLLHTKRFPQPLLQLLPQLPLLFPSSNLPPLSLHLRQPPLQ